MAYWTHSKFADPENPRIELGVGKQCRSIVELPGVPSGTQGRVMLANGFEWRRYVVLFDNGVELNGLDARHLEPPAA